MHKGDRARVQVGEVGVPGPRDIAARNAAIEELVADTALIVDDSGLADAMLRLERDPQLQGELTSAGRLRAADYSWSRSARAHIEAYTLARDSR